MFYFTYVLIILYFAYSHQSNEIKITFNDLNLTSSELIFFDIENSLYKFIFINYDSNNDEKCNSPIIEYSSENEELISICNSNLYGFKDITQFKYLSDNESYYFLYRKNDDDQISLYYNNNNFYTGFYYSDIEIKNIFLTIMDSKLIFILPKKNENYYLNIVWIKENKMLSKDISLNFDSIKCIEFKNSIICITISKNSISKITKINFNGNDLSLVQKTISDKYLFDIYNNYDINYVICISNDNLFINCSITKNFDDDLIWDYTLNIEQKFNSFEIIKDYESIKLIIYMNDYFIIQNLNSSINSIMINNEKRIFRYQSNYKMNKMKIKNDILYTLTKNSDNQITINKYSDYTFPMNLYFNNAEKIGIPFNFTENICLNYSQNFYPNDLITKKEEQFYFSKIQLNNYTVNYYCDNNNYYNNISFSITNKGNEIYCPLDTYYKEDSEECLEDPPEGYFIDNIQKKIFKCSNNCTSCLMIGIGLSKCIKCKENFKLYNYNCENQCPKNTFKYNDNCYDECPSNTLAIEINNDFTCWNKSRNNNSENISIFYHSNSNTQEKIINEINQTINNICENKNQNKNCLNLISLYNIYIDYYKGKKDYSYDLGFYIKYLFNISSKCESDSEIENCLDILETYINFFRNVKKLSKEFEDKLISKIKNDVKSLIKKELNQEQNILLFTLLNEYITNLKDLNSLSFEDKYILNNTSHFLEISTVVNNYTKGVMETIKNYKQIFLNLSESESSKSFYSSKISFANFNFLNLKFNSNSNLNVSIYSSGDTHLSAGETLKTLKSFNTDFVLIFPSINLNISYILITKMLSYPYLNKDITKYISNKFYSVNFYNSDKKEIEVKNLNLNITLAFKKENSDFRYCIFFNEISNKFSSDGCFSQILGNYIICTCNHLTDFSLSYKNLNSDINNEKQLFIDTNFWSSRIISSSLELNYFTLKNSFIIYIFILIFGFHFIFLFYTLYWDFTNYDEKETDLFIRYIQDFDIERQIYEIKLFIDEEINHCVNDENSEEGNKSISEIEEEENDSDDSNNEYDKPQILKEINEVDKITFNNNNEIMIEMQDISLSNNNKNNDNNNNTLKINKLKLKHLSVPQFTNDKLIKEKRVNSMKRPSINLNQLKNRVGTFKYKHKKSFVNNMLDNKRSKITPSPHTNKQEKLLIENKNEKLLTFKILFCIMIQFEYRFCLIFSNYPLILTKTSILTLITFRFIFQIGFIIIFSKRYSIGESLVFWKEFLTIIVSVIVTDIFYSIFKFILMKKKVTVNMDKIKRQEIKYKSIFLNALSFFLIVVICGFICINSLWVCIFEIKNNIKIHYLINFIFGIIIDNIVYEVLIITIKALFLNLLLSKYNKKGCFYKVIICFAKTFHNLFVFYIVE